MKNVPGAEQSAGVLVPCPYKPPHPSENSPVFLPLLHPCAFGPFPPQGSFHCSSQTAAPCLGT